MKLRHILTLLITAAVLHTAAAQQLYRPRNIMQAIAAGTRTMQGLPGKNYWQNTGHYNIAFTVNTQNKSISGTEEITYYNNSPDELKSIALRFVNNIHKPGAPRAGYHWPDFLTSGLHIKSLTYNGQPIPVNSADWGTVTQLKLPAAIKARGTARFTVEWEYPLSKQSGREGQIDSLTFYCAYAYPRVSVYDDYNGWDMLPHSDGQEFYNDFNNYEYTVAAPANWVVWGTGTFLNPQQVLSPAAYKRYKQSLTGSSTVHVATAADMQAGTVTAQKPLNIWRYKAENVSDICFAASRRYVWDASSVQLKSHRVGVHAAYDSQAPDFKHYVQWQNYCVQWFSNNYPGIDYPFPTITAVQGFADMEYPGMVNDATTADLMESRFTVDHEIAHTWFPFYMGTNETRYAYMDEGWAVTLEYLIAQAEHGKAAADSAFKSFRVSRYAADNSAEQDQPIITMSSQLSGRGYGTNAYVKPALSYLALKDMLGDALFKKALHYYMNAWHGKHPTPWDFFGCMNLGSGQNLNWFFQNWFFTNNYIDLSVKAAQVNNNVNVQLHNTGGFYIPFNIVITYTTGQSETRHYTPAIWQNSKGSLNLTIPVHGTVKSIHADGGIFMDSTPADNTITL